MPNRDRIAQLACVSGHIPRLGLVNSGVRARRWIQGIKPVPNRIRLAAGSRWSTLGFPNDGHPLRRFLRVEPEVFMQSLQRLQRGKLGLRVHLGLENRERPAASLRQPARLFRHYLAVVNFYFQRKIAHAKSITVLAIMAKQVSSGCKPQPPEWLHHPCRPSPRQKTCRHERWRPPPPLGSQIGKRQHGSSL